MRTRSCTHQDLPLNYLRIQEINCVLVPERPEPLPYLLENECPPHLLGSKTSLDEMAESKVGQFTETLVIAKKTYHRNQYIANIDNVFKKYSWESDTNPTMAFISGPTLDVITQSIPTSGRRQADEMWKTLSGVLAAEWKENTDFEVFTE